MALSIGGAYGVRPLVSLGSGIKATRIVDTAPWDLSLNNTTTETVNIPYTIETEAFALKTPAKNGYTFTGWTGDNGTNPQTVITIEKGTTGDKNYEANWNTITYDITIDCNGGTGVYNTTYTIETETFTLETPTRLGYEFTGWTGSNGTTPQTSVSVAKGSTGDKEYKANWKIVDYTITYELNDGTLAIANPTKYTVETETFTLNNPSKVGYTFAGWTGSNNTTPETSVSVAKGSTGNKNYTANWTVNGYEYNVVYKSTSGIELGRTTVLKEYGTTNVVTAPEITGYDTPASQTIAWDSVTAKTIEFIYKPISYSVTIGLNGGTGVSSTSYTIETPTFSLGTPSRNGYTFTGWTGDNGSTPETTVTISKGSTGARNYAANWSTVTYNITFNLDGGTGVSDRTYTIETETFTLGTPTRTGYTFTGWTGDNGDTAQTSVSIAKGSIGNKEYTANWSANGYAYNVVYKSSTGISLGSTTVTYNFGTTNTISAPAKTGYTTPASQEVAWDSVTAKTITFTYEPIEYNVTFTLNGGSGVSNRTYTVETATFTLGTPSKTGYEFTGWTGDNGTTAQTSVSITKGSTGDKSYTANWDTVSYNITFKLNGGTGVSNRTYTIETATFTLDTPSRTGYTFTGWTGDNVTTPQTSVSIVKGTTGDKEYTANWSANNYTYNVVYVSSTGVDLGSTTVTKAFGTTNTITAVAKTGYTTPASQSIAWDSTEAKTITFEYEPIEYNVELTLNGGTLDSIVSKAQVGDYVNYSANGIDSWRVFDIVDGEVLITPADGATTETLTLSGVDGYVNGISDIEEACDAYTNSSLGITESNVRSMTVEDINRVAGYTPSVSTTKYAYFLNSDSTYDTATVTSGYTKAKHTASFYNGLTTPRFYTWDSAANVSGDENGIEYVYPTEGNPVYATRDYYHYSISDKTHVNNSNVNVVDLLGSSDGWLASTCVYANSSYADFGVRNVNSSFVYAFYLAYSNGDTDSTSYGVRPLVSLGSGIKATRTSETAPWDLSLNNTTTEVVNIPYTVETETFTLGTPVKEGYKFAGWTGTNGTTAQTTVSIAKGSTGNKNYTANWIELVAQAIYSADDNSLTFIRDVLQEKDGTYNNKAVTAVYTGIETDTYEVTLNPDDGYISDVVTPWYDYRNIITSVTFEDTISPVSTAGWFCRFWACNSFDLAKLDTSKVTNMSGMFAWAGEDYIGVKLDMSNFDTSNVEDMSFMFGSCNFVNLDVDHFNTSKVKDMQCMFGNLTYLQNVNVSGWNTANVTNMYYMFGNCPVLESLDLSNWKTGNVTNMMAMFSSCVKLKTLNVSNWDTKNVNDMSYMFGNCNVVQSLDVSNFKTSNVKKMNHMFSGCKAITSLNVSGFDVSQVNSMRQMFINCTALTSIDVGNFNTMNVSDFSSMFNGCAALTTLDVSKFDLSKASTIAYMFQNCTLLEELIVNGLDTSAVTSMFAMFYNLPSLKTLDLSSWDTSNVSDIEFMIGECPKLEKVVLGSKFKFAGNGTTSFVLPTPDSNYIPGADGKWYNIATNIGYAPADVPSNTAATYVAVAPLIPGLYDANNNLLASWDTLVNTYGMDAEKDYTYPTYATDTASPYYVLTNNSALSSGVKLIIDDNVTNIGAYSFFGCENLVSVTIPSSVICIGEGAFSDCSELTSATIPNGVISIGSGAFECCFKLGGELVIPNSVTTIGDYAFNYCENFTNLTIPDSVTNIGINPFSGCSSLTSITVDEKNTVYHSNGNCIIETATGTLVGGCKNSIIPTDGSVTSIGEAAFQGCYSLTEIFIPASVTDIGMYAFYGCTDLADITISDGVINIEHAAFFTCVSLTEINFPDSVTYISEGALNGCRSLESITVGDGNTIYHSDGNCLIKTASKILIAGCKNSIIPTDGSVTSIGSWAFSHCYDLTSITIPNTVTSIGAGAFNYCNKLTSITIPNSVTKMGTSTFSNCNSLTSVIFENTSGWYISTSFSATSGTSVTVTNSATAATYLKSTYCSYYWFRK